MKLIDKFAKHCGLVGSEKSWLVQEVSETARTCTSPADPHWHELPSMPSWQELHAFDTVLKGLLEAGAPATWADRDAIRTKVARGCLRGVEQDELYLTDEIIVAAVDTMHAIGAFEPEDVQHLATFLGQFSGAPNLKHVAFVCEDLVQLETLRTVDRLDLILAMLASFDLPFLVRSKVLRMAVESPSFPTVSSAEILERVLLGSNLYKPLPLLDEGQFLDARSAWQITEGDPRRGRIITALGQLAEQLTMASRERSRAEMADLDTVLDWLESEEGSDFFEDLCFRMASRLPEFVETPEDHASDLPGMIRIAPTLHALESNIQAYCERVDAPRRSSEVVLVALTHVLEELTKEAGEADRFAQAIREGDSGAEATLIDTSGHVLECSIVDSMSQLLLPLGQLAEMIDEDLARIQELCLAVRDRLKSGEALRVPPDLIELLAPFEARTAARLNRFADEDLSFLAARMLVSCGKTRLEVARLAASVWSERSLEIAGSEKEWVAALIAEHAALFEPELAAVARLGCGLPPEGSDSYN